MVRRRVSFKTRNSNPLSTHTSLRCLPTSSRIQKHSGEPWTEPLRGTEMQKADVFRAIGKSSESNFKGKENSKVTIIISSMF